MSSAALNFRSSAAGATLGTPKSVPGAALQALDHIHIGARSEAQLGGLRDLRVARRIGKQGSHGLPLVTAAPAPAGPLDRPGKRPLGTDLQVDRQRRGHRYAGTREGNIGKWRTFSVSRRAWRDRAAAAIR